MRIDNKILKNAPEKTISLLISLYFVLKPFYFWKSGLPQISDYILCFLIITYMINSRFKLRIHRNLQKFIIANYLFVLYIFFINAVWTLLLNGELPFLKVSSYYLFNIIVCTFFSCIIKNNSLKFYKNIYVSILISVFIQVLFFIIKGGFSGQRVTIFFNNPNQLGYFSLLSLAILLFISQKLNIKVKWFIVGVFSFVVLNLVSLSKAAIVSSIGMLLFFLLFKRENKKLNRRVLICIILLIVFAIIIYQYNEDIFNSISILSSAKNRLSRIGHDSDDSLTKRGYDRLIKYRRYLFFGAGEGVTTRFESKIELHSTLGNILMSYGIIGFGLFLLILGISFKLNRWKDSYLIFFIMLYGLTHNGIRNTLFWILIAIISTGDKKENNFDVKK